MNSFTQIKNIMLVLLLAFSFISCGGSNQGEAVCGNNSRELQEICDGDDLGEETCQAQGFGRGQLFCNADCLSVSTTQCSPKPEVSFHFPPSEKTFTSSNQLTVRGVIEEFPAEGLVLNNNGIETAPIYNKDFSIPILDLFPGENLLQIVDIDGVVLNEINVTRSAPIRNPLNATIVNDHLYFLDYDTSAIVKVDLETRVATVFSGYERGSGPFFHSLRDIVFDEINNRFYVTDFQLDAIFAIDFESGNRTIFSDDRDEHNFNLEVGTGPSFFNPSGIEIDYANSRLLVLDNYHDSIFSVDLMTGNRTIISDDNDEQNGNIEVGIGPAFDLPGHMVLDDENGFLYVLDAGLDAVIKVDVISGNRMTFSDSDDEQNGNLEVGVGPAFEGPNAVVLDRANNRLLVNDFSLGSIKQVDLASGNRETISDNDDTQNGNLEVGTGPALINTKGMVIDPADNRLLVLGDSLTKIMSVELANGNRETFYEDEIIGSGVHLSDPYNLAIDANHNRLLISDDIINGLVEVDLNTGNRNILSGDDIGSSPIINFPHGFVVDSINNSLYLTDINWHSIFKLNLDNGNRETFSDGEDSQNGDIMVGLGPDLFSPRGIALDMENNRLFVSNTFFNSIMLVDLATGNRSTFSDDDDTQNGNLEVGVGPAFLYPYGVELDSANNRLLVTDIDLDSVLAVDLTTGDRSTFSDDEDEQNGNLEVGAGPAFNIPYDLVLDIENNRLLVIDEILHALIAVDLNTGDRTIISNNYLGYGPRFYYPRGLALNSEKGILYVTNRVWKNVYIVDIYTGDRVLMSGQL